MALKTTVQVFFCHFRCNHWIQFEHFMARVLSCRSFSAGHDDGWSSHWNIILGATTFYCCPLLLCAIIIVPAWKKTFFGVKKYQSPASSTLSSLRPKLSRLQALWSCPLLVARWPSSSVVQFYKNNIKILDFFWRIFWGEFRHFLACVDAFLCYFLFIDFWENWRIWGSFDTFWRSFRYVRLFKIGIKSVEFLK